MKKVLIIGGVAIAIGVIAYLVVKRKKPCPCKGMSAEEAINKMSKEDLIEQIKSLKESADIEGKSIAELKAELKALV